MQLIDYCPPSQSSYSSKPTCSLQVFEWISFQKIYIVKPSVHRTMFVKLSLSVTWLELQWSFCLLSQELIQWLQTVWMAAMMAWFWELRSSIFQCMLTSEVRQKVGCILAILQFCLSERTVDKLVIASLFLKPKVTPQFTLRMSQRDKLCFFKTSIYIASYVLIQLRQTHHGVSIEVC